MQLVHVYPLVRGTPLQTLSYFSRIEYPRGSLIDVLIRRKRVPAIVARSEPLEDARAKVRRADRALAPIKAQQPRTVFLPELLDAVECVALSSAGSPGAILHSILPASILEKTSLDKGPTFITDSDGGFEHLLLQARRMDRKSELKTLVRERFARNQSVLIVVPNAKETSNYAAILGEGLEANRTIVFHSALSAKQTREVWRFASRYPGPILLITTPAGIGIPRTDLGIIIIEHENAAGYVREARPYTDVRDVAEAYARTLSIPYLSSGALLRVQSLHRFARGKAAEYRPLRTRAHGSARVQVVDMREYKSTGRGEYAAISHELATLVGKAGAEQKPLFILSGRRGLASSVICADCGESVQCARCEAPVALHEKKGESVFLCHHCNTLGDALARCRACTSWKLMALGSGSELIEKQLKRITAMPVYRIDSDSAKTPKAAQEIMRKAAAEPSILIGTELALPHLPETIPNSAVTAIDSLFGVPDFALDERLFSLLLALRERTEETLLIQTRSPAHPTLVSVASGDIRGFQERELSARHSFGFPPYAALVSLSLFGSKGFVTKEAAKLASRLAPYKPTLLPAQKGARRGTELVLQIPESRWPDRELLSLLRALAPQWDISIRT